MRNRSLYPIGIILLIVALCAACTHSDSVITTKVKAKLATDPAVQAARFEVTTDKQVVTLTGNVDSQGEKDRALELARGTSGVMKVVDMVSVRDASGDGEAPEPGRLLGVVIDDATITASVKARLLDDPLVHGLRIDVDTREGVVYLTGSVKTAEEKDRAIELARVTEHVRDVQPNLVVESLG
jgi:hyperosmotically inducible periplasmic protein